jgi:hypothetical protein
MRFSPREKIAPFFPESLENLKSLSLISADLSDDVDIIVIMTCLLLYNNLMIITPSKLACLRQL